MNEILLTSAALILVILLARWLFRGRVSQRLIYSAWLLVAVRLLVPVQLFDFQFSILQTAEPVTQVITQISTTPVAGPSRDQVFDQIVQDYIEKDTTVFVPEVQEQIKVEISQGTQSPSEIFDKIQQHRPKEEILIPEVQQQVAQQVEESITVPTVGQIALAVWFAGMALMALWFLFVNLRHGYGLRKDAQPMECSESPVPVRISSKVDSPCLVGFFRPVVYLTPASAESPQTLKHVLAHELTHLRHGDHIWSLVRCICLCIYWFNPLVWLAAYLSRRDCELACDEGALKRLGEQERIAYGKTLLEVVSHASSPLQLLQTATSMNETRKQLTERVNFIVKKPKFIITAAICMVLICTIAVGCAFTSAPEKRSVGVQPNIPEPTVPPTYPTIPEGVVSTHNIVRDEGYFNEESPKPKDGEILVFRSKSSLDAYRENTLGTEHYFSEILEVYTDEFFQDSTLVVMFWQCKFDTDKHNATGMARLPDGSYRIDMNFTTNISCVLDFHCDMIRLEVDGFIEEDAVIRANLRKYEPGFNPYESHEWQVVECFAYGKPSSLVALVRSKSELESFCRRRFGTESEAYKLVEQYDDEFFETKTLALGYFTSDTIGEYIVTGVTKSSYGWIIEVDHLAVQNSPLFPEGHLVCVELGTKLADDTRMLFNVNEQTVAPSRPQSLTHTVQYIQGAIPEGDTLVPVVLRSQESIGKYMEDMDPEMPVYQVLQQYDAGFFEKNSLVIMYYSINDYQSFYRVRDILRYSDGTLGQMHIEMERVITPESIGVRTQWTVLIEIKEPLSPTDEFGVFGYVERPMTQEEWEAFFGQK